MPEPVINAIVLFFVWLLAVAGWHKLTATAYYESLIKAYLTPAAPARVLTVLVAVAELVAVSLLLRASTRSQGLLLAMALLLGYALLMAWQLWRAPQGVNIKCGCAGPASELLVSRALIVRNLVCVGLAWIGLGQAVPAATSLQAWSLSTFAGLFMVLAYLCAEQLISNAQQFAQGRT